MPTGYGSVIEKGATFEEYLWTCAKAFGAFLHMRDMPFDAPIPQTIPNMDGDYYHNELLKDKAELAEVMKMSPAEAEKKAKAEFEENKEYYRKYNETIAKERTAYLAMRERVVSWVPPTKDHEGIKKFMIDQIDASLPSYHDFTAKQLTGAQWLKEKKADLKEEIAYNERHIAESEAQHAKTVKWVNDLREAVPVPKNMRPK